MSTPANHKTPPLGPRGAGGGGASAYPDGGGQPRDTEATERKGRREGALALGTSHAVLWEGVWGGGGDGHEGDVGPFRRVRHGPWPLLRPMTGGLSDETGGFGSGPNARRAAGLRCREV